MAGSFRYRTPVNTLTRPARAFRWALYNCLTFGAGGEQPALHTCIGACDQGVAERFSATTCGCNLACVAVREHQCGMRWLPK